MTKNPCKSGRTPDEIFCPHMAQDKNKEPCLNCQAKLEYAVSEGMLPEEVLEQKEDPLVKEAREMVPAKKEKLCIDCGWRPIKAKRRCNNCYGRHRYKKIHGKVRGYKKKEGVERWKGEHK